MKKPFFVLFFLLLSSLSLFAQIHGITALIHSGNEVISASQDGFIVIWDISRRTALQRFQLTTDRIQSIVHHPLNDEICIIEAANPENYRISAWNYKQKQKLFSLHSDRPVTYINYSANGSYIIASGLDGEQLVLLDSQKGELISVPDIPAGPVAFAATGRGERNMLLYQSEYEGDSIFESASVHSTAGGQILYLDLASGSVIRQFQAPGNLSNPVIFGNNRYIAGVNSGGLLVVDAASGAITDNINTVDRNALLYPLANGFYCLNRRGEETTLYRFSVDANGRLITNQELSLAFNETEQISSITSTDRYLAFASEQGNLFLLGPQNSLIPMTHNFQRRITEIAAGTRNIAFLTENGDLCIIPLDYRLLRRNNDIALVNKSGYTRLTAIGNNSIDNSLIDNNSIDQFILWQSTNIRNTAQMINADNPENPENISYLTGRFPLKSISSFKNRILILDNAGNLSVRNMESSQQERAEFTFSSVGSIDADFINDEYIILCRRVINNNSPFLFINYRTGETVPIFYNAQTILAVTPSKQGNIYAETIELKEDKTITKVIDLSPIFTGGREENPASVIEYLGEAAWLSIAESSGRLAISIGSEGAFITGDRIVNFERTNALPVKLLGSSNFFLSLDSEGSIAWHDNRSGRILAVFSLHDNRWTLQTNTEISGSVTTIE